LFLTFFVSFVFSLRSRPSQKLTKTMIKRSNNKYLNI
jgi:hypothetical protein